MAYGPYTPPALALELARRVDDASDGGERETPLATTRGDDDDVVAAQRRTLPARSTSARSADGAGGGAEAAAAADAPARASTSSADRRIALRGRLGWWERSRISESDQKAHVFSCVYLSVVVDYRDYLSSPSLKNHRRTRSSRVPPNTPRDATVLTPAHHTHLPRLPLAPRRRDAVAEPPAPSASFSRRAAPRRQSSQTFEDLRRPPSNFDFLINGERR